MSNPEDDLEALGERLRKTVEEHSDSLEDLRQWLNDRTGHRFGVPAMLNGAFGGRFKYTSRDGGRIAITFDPSGQMMASTSYAIGDGYQGFRFPENMDGKTAQRAIEHYPRALGEMIDELGSDIETFKEARKAASSDPEV